MEQNKFVENTWTCKCGALNASTRTDCGKCGETKN